MVPKPSEPGRRDPEVSIAANGAEVFTLGVRPGAVRLVFLSHSYFPALGGSERFVQGLAEGAARHGFTTTVVTRQDPGTAAREEVGGVTVVRLPMRNLAGFHFPRRYRPTLRELRPDLVHLIGNRVWAADYYLPYAGSFDWAQVMTGIGFYQYEMHRRWWDRWYFERYLPRRIGRLDRYVACTPHERDQLLGWGVAPGRLAVVPLGIPLGEFEGRPSEPGPVRDRWGLGTPFVALYAGGYYENKRVDRLVRSVAATGGRWGLVAFGRDVPSSPYSRPVVEGLARALGARTRFQEAVSRPAFLDGLAASDVAVLGSSYEGFGLFLLEAMAMGRPFVAYRTGVAPELAASGAGFAVATEAEFTDALRQLEDASLRGRMGARGRELVANYSVDREVLDYLALYEQTVAARRPGGAGSVP